MKISDVSIRKPVFASMMIVALLVLGMFSFSELSIDLYPEVDFPITVVQTVYPGASAETVETEVTKKIEDACNQVSGIRHITSTSRESFSLIVLEFELERDGLEATQEVREKVSQVRYDLPEDVDEPLVLKFDPMAMPILTLAISGKRDARDITELSKNLIKKRLESINGVGAVTLIGGQEREILVALDPVKMESRQVTVTDIKNAIKFANLEIPGGTVNESEREYVVRMAGRLNSVSQFNDIVIKKVEGTPVSLSDVARIVDTTQEQTSLSLYNGQSAVSLSIVKQSGANTVDVSSRVKKEIIELKSELPPDIAIEIVNDNAKFIEDSVHEIIFNIQFGTLLAVIVIFLFLLSSRPTIITGLSIPISIIATFTAMKILGYTLNIMTLMGLSLAVGILIDDAIVVVENIYRHMAMGKSPRQAAFDGTKEIGLAVMATTFSIVAVFIPIAFMEGMVGQFFTEFGITVAVAVLVSLFVAFTLTPMMSSRMLAPGRPLSDRPGFFGGIARFLNIFWKPILRVLSLWNKAFDSLKPRYERLLRASLNTRWLVILFAIFSFAGAIGIVYSGVIGSEFMTQTDEGKLNVTIESPPGTTLDGTYDLFLQATDIVTKIDVVEATHITIGAGEDPVTKGSMLVTLNDKSERDVTVFQVMDSVRVLLTDIPGMKYSVGLIGGESEGKPIQISVRGPEIEELTSLATQVQEIVFNTPGAIDVDNNMEEGKPELQVIVDRRKASELGLSLYEIPTTIQSLVEGDVVTRYKEGEEEYDVRIRLDEPFRNSTADIRRIPIRSDNEIIGVNTVLYTLDQVAKFRKTSAVGQLNRYDRQREIRIDANMLSGFKAGTAATLALEKAAELEKSPGYSIGGVGEVEMMEESFTNIILALMLAVVFIYLLLASQYESLFDPLAIMLSLPLSLIGAIIGLIGSSFSIMSMIGIVLLMGLVTKNAILLMDFVKQLREEGVSRYDAILKAGPIRLRPILMTTFATVFGMLPLALGIGPGAEFRAPMARAAIGGIISSTMLTLVVVPVVYTLIDDVVQWVKKKVKSDPSKSLTGI